MKLYDIRIWGKRAIDFVSFKCFSDCVPFDLDTEYTQGFDDFKKDQSDFLDHVISLINHDNAIVYHYNAFWLNNVSDIGTVFVILCDDIPMISANDLKKDS